MHNLTRITFNPEVMGGKPCIRGMRVTVGAIVGLVASGNTVDEVLADYLNYTGMKPAESVKGR